MRLLLVLAALLCLTACAAPASGPPSETRESSSTVSPVDQYSVREATVYRMVDGDTLDTERGKGGGVRILGIDSPETVDPSLPVVDGRRVPQCGGPESTAWARAQLPPGTLVNLVPDPSQDVFDIYDRSLAYVRYKPAGAADWLDFSVESVRAGMAKSYVYENNPVMEIDKIRAAETEAKNARRGLWQCPENLAR